MSDGNAEQDGQVKRTRNMLDRPTARRLEDWLSSNWPAIKKSGATMAQCAAEASAALDIPGLTSGNIRGAVQAIRKAWPGGRAVRARLERLEAILFNEVNRVTRLERRVLSLEQLLDPSARPASTPCSPSG